jgi:peptidoglycan/xylan/chitin deacetylase (PgdA/CDA1 family)
VSPRRLVALEYHDVVAGDDWDSSGYPGPAEGTYKLSVGDFAAHVDAVAQTGVAIVNDVSVPFGDNRPSTVVWTFDDGGMGYAAHAADLLEARGWRGHVFMTSSQVGKPGFLDAATLRDLLARGHVVGSHSRSHPPWISALPAAAIGEEWRTSREDLEQVLGKPVTVASVPGGFYSREVAVQAARHDITRLFTSEPVTRIAVVDGCAIIGRYTLRRHHSPGYAASLVASASMARAGQWCAWNAKKAAKRFAGPVYRRVRRQVLGS